jgi:dolichol-phosphate mannosyltransferase
MPTLSILIPCYNEENTIDTVIERVEQAPLPDGWEREVIIVDDGSTDRSPELLAKYATRHRVIIRAANGGKGAALKTGLEAVTGDFVIIQDADLEYQPEEYSKLLTLSTSKTSVFGSRVLQKNPLYSPLYFYGSRALTELFNLLFRSSLTDITTCYKLFPGEAIPALIAHAENGFVYDAVYLTHTLHRFGPITEVAISYAPRTRTEGKKIHWSLGFKVVGSMVKLFVEENPLTRAFLPYVRSIKFLCAGALVVIVNLTVLYLMTHFGHVHYLLSETTGFGVSFIVSFLLQKFWTFSNRELKTVHVQGMFYLLLQITNLGINLALLYLLVQYLHLWYLVSQILISLFLAVISYQISNRFIFIHSTSTSSAKN